MDAPDFSVADQRVVVTGASQGIGRSIAETLAAAGASVALCSRSMDRVGPVAEGINDADVPGEAFATECDVRDRDDVEAFFEAAADEFDGLDAAVNNAGGEFVAPFEDISEGGWEAVTDLNLGGTYRCCQVAGEYLRTDADGDGGTIVNMASVNGQHAAPNESHYGAAKAAIIRLTETLAAEWSDGGVRVNCIAPGLIQTPGVAETLGIDESDMPPREQVHRRIGHPEEIADLTAFLLSPAASFVTGETYTAKGVPKPGNSMNHDLGLQ
ncbi:SDR family NAD(P)-dependent oxidoreductase [Halorarius halobius]|uniref:SDR family NAD(P)-dependent oxidoreductase n=1 Tax=Halorarius halobius TaxID=2962671 RepID=UPI0020CBC544|nr:SDR family oxidoreductase [Halorarius halobius]